MSYNVTDISWLPSKTSSSEVYAETARKTKNSHPPSYLVPNQDWSPKQISGRFYEEQGI